MKTYITYNAGCDIWEVEPFDETIDWHNKVYQGTLEECNEEAKLRMNNIGKQHYPNAEYESKFDY